MFVLFKLPKKPKTSFNFYGDYNYYFDPLNITNTLTETQIKFWRESELQNGRICLFSNIITNIFSINHYEKILIIYLFYLICFEYYRYNKYYNNIFTPNIHQPGYYNYYIPFNVNLSNLELFCLRISMILYLS